MGRYVNRCSGNDQHDPNCGGTCGEVDIDARPNPTPKLTAEHCTCRSCLKIRAKAFEDAAEIQPLPLRRPGTWASLDYKAGWDSAMTAKANAIRALAKEKG